MQIYEVTDARFRKYGKVIRNIDFSALTEAMKKTPVPSDVVYEPSIAELEALPVAKEIEKVFYGEQSCSNRRSINIGIRGRCDR